MYACARTRVFSIHMSMCVYMCANVYMCAGVTRTHVYVCVHRRGMGACVTRMRPCVFYRAFYYIIDHTMGSYLVYICAPMSMWVHVYASISIYFHAFTYAYVRACNNYMQA